MAESSEEDVTYGQFGLEEYSPEELSWTFHRIETSAASFVPLHEPQILVPAVQPGSFDDDTNSSGQQPAKRYERQIKALVRSHADCQPSASLLSPLAKVSEIVQEAFSRYDSVRGCLTSSGSIPSKVYHRPIPVIAVVTGECQSKLLIFRTVTRSRAWNDDSLPSLKLQAKQTEEGIWTGSEGPIQQIKFRQGADRSSPFLAVRTLSATTIFHPLQEKSRQIHPNLLCKITVDQTGGASHSDVAFNPWFARQVALVDQSGRWTVLEFATRSFQRVVSTWTGRVTAPDPEDSPLIYDGWSRISWIASESTLVVCTRGILTLLDITSTEPATLWTLDLASAPTRDCVTDMTLLPASNRMNILAVSTSTYLKIYEVTRELPNTTGLKRISNLRHFRSPADLSLSLSASSSNNKTIIILYSKISPIVSCHPYSFAHADGVIHGNPILVQLPVRMPRSPSRCPITDLQISPIDVADASAYHEQHHSSVQMDLGQNQLFVLDVRLATGALYSCIYRLGRARAERPLQAPPSAQKVTHASRQTRASALAFVTTDDDNNGSTGEQAHRREPVSRRARRVNSPPKPAGRALPFESIVRRVNVTSAASRELGFVLSDIRRALKEPTMEDIPPLRSLCEQLSTEVTFHDAGEDNAQFHEITNLSQGESHHVDAFDFQTERPRRLVIEAIPLPSCLEQDFPPDAASLSTAYNAIITTWITSLPDSISMRTRLAKEQLARRIASEVVLAQQSARSEHVSDTQASQDTQDEKPPPSSTWELPVRTGDSSLRRPFDHHDRFHLPALSLPTPSPTATPSVTTASSAFSALGGREVSRLSQYTTFSKPAPLALPRNINTILSHWTVGEDPAQYDWLSTAVARRNEEANESMTDRERHRAQRRAERHIRRQRKEVAASQAQQFASSQAVEIASASQPTINKVESRPMAMGLPSSSQTVDPFSVGASQVMPGRFGGRPPPKKKARKSGF